MKEGRVWVYDLGEKVETDEIYDSYTNLQALTLRFAKVMVEQFGKHRGYRVDFKMFWLLREKSKTSELPREFLKKLKITTILEENE